MFNRFAVLAVGVVAIGCAGDGPGAGSGPLASPIEAGPVAMRRLTETQYRASVADILGDGLSIAGRIEPDNRRSGLLAVGSSYVSVTAAGFEQYESIARSLAEQALAPERRADFVPCEPADGGPVDADCAAMFIRKVGGRLLRRPLTDAEVESRVAIAAEAGATLGDFYAGLELVLTTLLVSPDFLFRIEDVESGSSDAQRLTSRAMATRLSYFLWNSTPDEELQRAAEAGELIDDEGVATQVDRMLESPRIEDSVRAFFGDLYSFEDIEQGLVSKDPTLFPAFTQDLIGDAGEQTLRVIVDHMLTSDGDYRDLFTTRQSFMTRKLGVVYRVPVAATEGWEPFEFPADGERAGILTHLSLLALHSHPGRSSPTLRGKFVREVLLCQDVPPPPGDIDFASFSDASTPNRRTARQRLEAHVANPACAGCHGLMDPIGLALEQLDGIGALRTEENGATIDPTGELDGVSYTDARGLGVVLSRHPALGPCFVRSFFRYATGRDTVEGEEPFLVSLEQRMSGLGYRMRDLMRTIALSDAFRLASGTRDAEVVLETPVPMDTFTPSPTAPPPDGTPRTATATRPRPPATATPQAASFAQIRDEILTPKCATQFCHSSQTMSGGLVLEGAGARDNLVGVAPTNPAAAERGWSRVQASDPDNSFLMVKIIGPNESALGSRMPLGGSALSSEEVALIEGWITAGAGR